MNKLEIAQLSYTLLNNALAEKKMTEEEFNQIINESGQFYRLTKNELRDAEPDFRDFIIKNNLLVSAIDVYGFTDPYDDFSYSFERLNLHLDFSYYAFSTLIDVAESNFESVLGSLDISDDSDLYNWENFETKVKLTRDEIIFEQDLISLLTIFEAYITHILQWIFQKDESVRHKIRVNIDYDEVLENLDEIVPFLILKKIEQIRNWDDRIDTIQNKPIQIRIKDKTEYRIIKDAIAKRNLLIHNKGFVNNKFLKEIHRNNVSDCNIKNDYSIDDKIKIDRPYYYQVQGAIHNLVIFIDDEVKEKYV